jgi:hypothetical protein
MANAPSDNGKTENDKTEDNDFVSKSELTTIVNQAVSSQLKRSLGKSIGEAVEAALAPIKEQLQARTEEPKDKQQSPEAIELAKLKEQFQKSEKARKTSEHRAFEERAYNALTSELTASGRVKPEAINVVADLLRARQVLRVGEDGSARYHVSDDEHFDLKEGVTSHFLKSKEASMFLVAPGTNPGMRPQPAPFGSSPTKLSAPTQQQPTGTPFQRAQARAAEAGIDLNAALGG